MDFNIIAATAITVILTFFSACIRLIFWPYKTMRDLRIRNSKKNIIPLYVLFAAYFIIMSFTRGFVLSVLAAAIACGEYVGSILFFSLLPSRDDFLKRLNAYVTTWTYTLIPTFFWFYSSLFLYHLLPPPRTTSFLGKSFSIIFFAYSISLTVWKLILVYLSIRFSSKIQVPRIIYYFLLYLAVFAPVWILLYKLGVSRIPFI